MYFLYSLYNKCIIIYKYIYKYICNIILEIINDPTKNKKHPGRWKGTRLPRLHFRCRMSQLRRRNAPATVDDPDHK